MSDQDKDDDQQSTEKHPPTVLGWIVRVFSLAMLALLVGIIVWKMTTETQEIAFESELVTEEVRQQGDGWLVPIDVTNKGSRTAHLLRLEVTAGDTKEIVEIPMIGASETVRYVIRTDAQVDVVSHEIVSYETP